MAILMFGIFMTTPVGLKFTPLHALHISLQAKMVPFAGYDMPVQYPTGVLTEHRHTRNAAGLFDISHMGQIVLRGDANIHTTIEKIMPGEFQELIPGQIRYSFLLNEKGGVLDDLMVTRPASLDEQNQVFIIVNATCKDTDLAFIKKHLPNVKAEMLADRGLLALQGPKAAEVLARFCDAPNKLKFMQADKFEIPTIGLCFISRSGYTGEDGFEISVPAATVEKFARQLLDQPEILPIGLAARDSLRLEAGLCLYGHELDPTISPIEAALTWAIGKRRRVTDDFIGAAAIQEQLKTGVTRRRVGIKPEGRALARENTEILNSTGQKIGIVTSGGFGPTIDGPICMGYVETAYTKAGTTVSLLVRGNTLPAQIVSLPFVPHHYLKD